MLRQQGEDRPVAGAVNVMNVPTLQIMMKGRSECCIKCRHTRAQGVSDELFRG